MKWILKQDVKLFSHAWGLNENTKSDAPIDTKVNSASELHVFFPVMFMLTMYVCCM